MNKQLAADFKTNSSGSSTGAHTECLSSHFALTTEKQAAKKVFSDCLYKFNSFVQLLSLHCGNTNNELKKYDDLVPSNEIGLGCTCNRLKILFNCSFIFFPFSATNSTYSPFTKTNKDTLLCAAVILWEEREGRWVCISTVWLKEFLSMENSKMHHRQHPEDSAPEGSWRQ